MTDHHERPDMIDVPTDDTRPRNEMAGAASERPTNPIGYPVEQSGLQAPPKILFYGVIFLFMLAIIGTLSGVVIFRDVLRPAQQQRVMDIFPFMEALLPPRPAPDAVLPTSSAPVDEEAARGLLESPLNLGGTDTQTDTDPTPEQPAEAPPVATTPEATPEPTEPVTPEAEPTEAAASASSSTQAGGIPVGGGAETAVADAPAEPTPAPAQPEVASARVDRVDPDDSTAFFQSERTWRTSAVNTGFSWERQNWNNCGPASITIAMSYFGWQQDQTYARERIRPEREDKNTSPHEMVEFVEEYSDLNALYRYGGDLDTLRRLIDNGFPVIIERSHMFEGYEWLGHYQTLVGYDDLARHFYIYDSFLGIGDYGAGINETYDEVDAGWQQFNRIFIVLYTPDREQLVMSILGEERATLDASAEHAARIAQEEARANPQDAFAWFNIGTSLNELEMYEEAARYFDRALILGLPWRMLWYQFGPFEAYYHAGRYDDMLSFVTNSLNNGGQWVEETYYWQGRALAALGDTSNARSAFRQALRINRLFDEAQEALDALG
ncbi:MAG: C39 family peptidase [Phototrophicaceae bacterium]